MRTVTDKCQSIQAMLKDLYNDLDSELLSFSERKGDVGAILYWMFRILDSMRCSYWVYPEWIHWTFPIHNDSNEEIKVSYVLRSINPKQLVYVLRIKKVRTKKEVHKRFFLRNTWTKTDHVIWHTSIKFWANEENYHDWNLLSKPSMVILPYLFHILSCVIDEAKKSMKETQTKREDLQHQLTSIHESIIKANGW